MAFQIDKYQFTTGLIKEIYSILKKVKNRTVTLLLTIRYYCSRGITRQIKSCYEIPIIINNFNRLVMLKKLIESLELRGYTNIYIIDNASTYPPLLEYYKNCQYTIFRLSKNTGHCALWASGIYEMFKRDYYVYTDPDMQIDEMCPSNFLEYFKRILQKYPMAQKVGFGIRIDDLPDTYIHKGKVLEWESQFWRNEIKPGLFKASVDTTFALYRPYCFGGQNNNQKVFRTGFPYVIRHLPWYNLEEAQSEECYYKSHINTSTHWSCVN